MALRETFGAYCGDTGLVLVRNIGDVTSSRGRRGFAILANSLTSAFSLLSALETCKAEHAQALLTRRHHTSTGLVFIRP